MKNSHIVRVGPVHAGVIEPGVFRFTCNGERVERLEIELGFQHRGIEQLIAASADNPRRMMCLAEQIAGDTSVGHALAMAQIMDGDVVNPLVKSERRVALEMERVAMNLADASAMLGDVSYRLGMVALQALRTLIINATQRWCGNRFGRTLIRPSGSYYRLTLDLIKDFEATLADVLPRVEAVRRDAFASPSVLSRLEEICIMSAPAGRYSGDLAMRLAMRFEQIAASGAKIHKELHYLAANWFEPYAEPMYNSLFAPNTTLSSRVEAWRGRITHKAKISADGQIIEYRIIDPSASLWAALASSMAGAEISDFPVNNKSFNLSYCGVDL